MRVAVQIIETGATPGILKREMRRMWKVCWQKLGEMWHARYREKHFTNAGAREYGYTPRQGEKSRGEKGFWRSYSGRKLRKFGHMYPLVYTGESRMRTRIRDVRSTSNGVRIVMNAPTFNRRGSGSNVDMRDEMTRVSDAELKALLAEWQAWLDVQIRDLQGVRNVRAA